MTDNLFSGRVGLQQRVLPTYRAAFMEALAARCQGGLSVFAGEPLPIEGIEPADTIRNARLVKAKNWNLLDPGSAWYLCWQSGFTQWLEQWQPEVLIVEANPRYPATSKAITWMHTQGRKVIGWGLGAPPIHGPLSAIRQRQRMRLLHSLDAVIAYSQQGAAQYRQMGLPTGSVYVASNAVAPAPTSPPPLRPDSIAGQPTILFVGRLQARKRVDLLIQACARLRGDLQPRLIIVGDGPVLDDLHQLGQIVYPAATFTGAKHGQELEPYFAEADLFVLPGSGGLAIQEAMAHGLPVVVAQGDGTQDDLVRPENGWQIPPGDLAGLIEILQRALTDPIHLRQMGAASYRIVASEINVERMVEAFLQVLNTL